MRQDRQTVAQLLVIQAPRLGLQVVAEQAPGCYLVDWRGRRLRMLMLTRSHDYWLKRLALRQGQWDQLCVVRHDSCVPLPVLDLERGYLYAPYEPPPWYRLGEQLTRRTAPVFLGQLLCGVQAAWERLGRLPRGSRARYQRRLQALVQRVPGRPVGGSASSVLS
ncbi:MAG: hypothetical protein IRZ31_17955 [Thermogemmatispora sp.]|uniref:hypothetical protein n=1 Tax=Thermogemmatispora sp. TaxID=1968838 RepID=UPI0026374E9B|nr:hypothetical protein [Thermogemmatispora sp.]MBX5458780.1 hypothetical protein [Thermogemmatispora sp.]